MKIDKQTIIVFLVAPYVLVACGGGYLTDSRSAPYIVDSGVGMGKRWVDTREVAAELRAENLTEDGIHDPASDAIAVLQKPGEAMGAFPLDRSGAVDWGKALELGVINPRADLDGKTDMVVMDKDVILKETGDMSWVRFSHAAHTKWLGCDTCHSGIFIPKMGANEITMDGMFAGEQCGICHGSVAFALMVCERCHNTPKENSSSGAQTTTADQ